jgi:hypothetical protein
MSTLRRNSQACRHEQKQQVCGMQPFRQKYLLSMSACCSTHHLKAAQQVAQQARQRKPLNLCAHHHLAR